MTTLNINGREVKTNWREGRYDYPFCDGNGRPGWRIELKEPGETLREMVERLGQRYSRVSLYTVTTRVRGYYEHIAFCK